MKFDDDVHVLICLSPFASVLATFTTLKFHYVFQSFNALLSILSYLEEETIMFNTQQATAFSLCPIFYVEMLYNVM